MIFLAWKSLTQPTQGLPSALFNRPHSTPHKSSTAHSAHAASSHPHSTTLTLHPPSSSSAASVASSANTSVRSHNPYISETESESETVTPRGTLDRADSAHSMHSAVSTDTVSTMGEEPGVLYSRSKVPALGVGSVIGHTGSGSQPGSAANSARDDNGNR